MIRYTLQEARRLVIYAHTSIKQCWSYWLEWSNWRRKHQASACYYHYQRQRKLCLHLPL
ncbi:hypothetical protein [Neochlamydia sp. AcF65]|uniref:hypothetical protein n=1 Tax=Neochlamydia sp. AcF65 TaxID=2795735 RepID=UPI001BC93F72|nr:hypothetical protein [Neochlamydia sp. AcF65]